jgi:hypothetical protein
LTFSFPNILLLGFFCTNIQLNIHGKRVIFNADSALNGRKSAHPAL